MRRTVFILLSLLGVLSCAEKEDGITVVFNVSDVTHSKVGLVIDRSTKAGTDISEDGTGVISLRGLRNVYANILYGEAVVPVYLGEEGKVTISFSGKDVRNTIEVSAPYGEANRFLQNQYFPEPPSFELGWEEFSKETGICIEKSTDQLKIRGLTKSSPKFAEVEAKRIRYLFGQQLVMYNMWHSSLFPDYEPSDSYFERLREDITELPELADVAAYRQYVIFALAAVLEAEAGTHFSAYERTLHSLEYVAENFRDPKIRNTFARCLFLEYVSSNGISGTEKLQEIVRSVVTDGRILEEIEEEISNLDPATSGKPSPDFKGETACGEVKGLDDFLGRFIYIDVWASWCSPCKKEIPALKKLEERFPGICFVSLSVDKDRESWRKYIDGKSLSSNQLWIGDNSQFSKDFRITAIPRFILVDPEGKIVESQMLRPSDPETIKYLEGLSDSEL